MYGGPALAREAMTAAAATPRSNAPRRDLPGDVAAVVDLEDLVVHALADALGFARRQLGHTLAEQIAVEVELLQAHLRVEDVLLVDVHVDHDVTILDFLRDEVLDRVDLVVDVVLHAADVAREA